MQGQAGLGETRGLGRPWRRALLGTGAGGHHWSRELRTRRGSRDPCVCSCRRPRGAGPAAEHWTFAAGRVQAAPQTSDRGQAPPPAPGSPVRPGPERDFRLWGLCSRTRVRFRARLSSAAGTPSARARVSTQLRPVCLPRFFKPGLNFSAVRTSTRDSPGLKRFPPHLAFFSEACLILPVYGQEPLFPPLGRNELTKTHSVVASPLTVF